MEIKFISGWDEQKYKELANRCDSSQLKKDVSYCCVLKHHSNPPKLHAEMIEDVGFYIGNNKQTAFRIIGIGVAKEHQRKGIGSIILRRIEEYCRQKGYGKIETRTLDGKVFYEKNGFQIVGMKGGDFLMEKVIDKTKLIPHTYGSPRWTGELNDCSLPMTLDTYSNCSFGCVYCFSQYQRGVGASAEKYFEKQVKSVNVEKIKRIFNGEDTKSQFYQFVKDRRPIQFGGLSDQFDGFEKKYGVTYELLKFFKEINYPICFSTKSAWVFHDPKYQELFRGQDNWNMKFSIITLDPEAAKKIEVGEPSPQERLEAMRIYSKLNKGGATLRLRPFIIGVTDKTYLDLIRAAHEAGATAVTTEFFCLENRSVNVAKDHYRTISECCGFDIVDYYRRYSNGTGYLRLNRKVKEKYVMKMKELCDELGMRFYVSDAHFKELSNNACCCGLPETWDYSRGHFSSALQIAKKTGFVRWSDIEKDMEHWERTQAVAAEGCQFCGGSTQMRAKFDGLTMKDYLRYLWNTPKSGKGPYRVFDRVLVPAGRDKNGDIIYKYNNDVTFIDHGNEDHVQLMDM